MTKTTNTKAATTEPTSTNETHLDAWGFRSFGACGAPGHRCSLCDPEYAADLEYEGGKYGPR